MGNPWQQAERAKKLSESGVWATVRIGDAEWRFLIRSREAKQYQQALERHMAPLRRRYRNQEVPNDVSQDALIRIFAEASIVDWQGVTDAAGEPLPCTLENKVLVLETFPQVRDVIAGTATEYGAFIAAAEEDREKN